MIFDRILIRFTIYNELYSGFLLKTENIDNKNINGIIFENALDI